MSRNERMDAVAWEMATLATRYDIPVLNTLQLNRDQKKE